MKNTNDSLIIDYRQQVAMTLSTIAYWPDTSKKGFESELEHPGYATKGEYSLVWGPSCNPNYPNYDGSLIYVTQKKGTDDYFVTIRGTDYGKWIDFIINVIEDVSVLSAIYASSYFPSNPDAYISSGTAYILSDIIDNLVDPDTNQSLASFMTGLATINNLSITGHSLGGNIATVVAPWLKNLLEMHGNSVSAYFIDTFAGPTAGNQAFAADYNASFQGASRRWINPYDIVPNGWASILNIENYYDQNGIDGPSCPPQIEAIIEGFNLLMDAWNVSYVQPGNAYELQYPMLQGTGDWSTEAFYQHSCSTYLSLMGAPAVNFCKLEQQLMQAHLKKLAFFKQNRVVPKPG